MSEKKHGAMTREAFLLGVRTKELARTREELAATEELVQLEEALIAALFLALDGKVGVAREEGRLCLPKAAVREALACHTVQAEDGGDCYRITVRAAPDAAPTGGTEETPNE